jgi:hypothetical protein
MLIYRDQVVLASGKHVAKKKCIDIAMESGSWTTCKFPKDALIDSLVGLIGLR